MKNYYRILGISEHASMTDIKKAYRALAVRYHPDKNPSPEARARFTEITEAYNTLSDPDKKFLYDHQWYKFSHQLVQEAPQQHRDPKYKPRTSNARPDKPRHYILMEKWNRYVNWINIFGVVMVVLFTMDYFLPYIQSDEAISGYKAVVGGRRSATFSHYRLFTDSGKDIKVYHKVGEIGENLTLTATPVFRIPMAIENVAEMTATRLAFIYQTHLLLFPVLLLFISAMGLAQRKSAERAFSYGIGTIILLIVMFTLNN